MSKKSFSALLFVFLIVFVVGGFVAGSAQEPLGYICTEIGCGGCTGNVGLISPCNSCEIVSDTVFGFGPVTIVEWGRGQEILHCPKNATQYHPKRSYEFTGKTQYALGIFGLPFSEFLFNLF